MGATKIMVIRHAEKPGSYNGTQYFGVNPTGDIAGAGGPSYTLTTADVGARIQVAVTANVNHTAFATGASLVNDNLRSYGNGGAYPVAPTTLTVGGVDFALAPDGAAKD